MKLSAKKVGYFVSGTVLIQLLFLTLADYAGAAFASRFNLTLREEYNDNIFFEKTKEADFITSIIPTFLFSYAPADQTTPIFGATLSPEGQIFARNSQYTNFGENVTFDTGYTYYHSPRLTVHASDSLRRRAATRTGAFGGSAAPAPTSLPRPGGVVGQPASQRLGDFVGNGAELSNFFSLRGTYLLDPVISLIGDYNFGYTGYLDAGGNDLSHLVGVRVAYKWKEEHNLNFGFAIRHIKSRDGSRNVLYNLDVGDDYLSSLKIDLDPTLTISAVSGISINSGGDGPTIGNRTNVSVTKLWERASLNLGVNKEMTPSFGVSGISDTTSFFTNFNTRVTEFIGAFAKVEYSLFDTKDVDFNTFLASTGIQYRIKNWLVASFQYSHRWEDSGSGAVSTELLNPGKVSGNSFSLNFTTFFDVWPRVGLGHAPGFATR